GRGKTGSQVADIASERKHHFRMVGAKENVAAAALTTESLAGIDCIVDFTAPHCVLANIEACVAAGKNMVVGTTGWYKEIDKVQELVKQHGTGFMYAANFSVVAELLIEKARTADA